MKITEFTDLAIVGNAGSLLGKSEGKQIDAHKYVARFNNYEIAGYEDAVGQRQDVWVTSLFTDVKPRSRRYKAVLSPFPEDCQRFAKRVYVYSPEVMNKHVVQWIPGEWFEQLRKHIKNPSTGIAFLWWYYKAMGRLQASQVFNFSFFRGKLHYFDDKSNTNHKGELEESLYKAMLEGKV